MAKLSKRQKALTAVDRERFYGVDEAIALVKSNATAKFDETVEIALNLGVDAEADGDVHRFHKLGPGVVLQDLQRRVDRILFAGLDGAIHRLEALADVCHVRRPPR